MTRFHIHIHETLGFIADEEGAELADLATAARRAIEGVRSILAEDLLSGAIDLRGRVEITDGEGAVLQVMRFQDLVEVIQGPGDDQAPSR